MGIERAGHHAIGHGALPHERTIASEGRDLHIGLPISRTAVTPFNLDSLPDVPRPRFADSSGSSSCRLQAQTSVVCRPLRHERPAYEPRSEIKILDVVLGEDEWRAQQNFA